MVNMYQNCIKLHTIFTNIYQYCSQYWKCFTPFTVFHSISQNYVSISQYFTVFHSISQYFTIYSPGSAGCEASNSASEQGLLRVVLAESCSGGS